MKYMVNFTVKIIYDSGIVEKERSSYSILEKDLDNYDILVINDVCKWFKNHFESKPLNTFIDISKLLNENYKIHMKIARITDVFSGKYKTY